MPQDTICCADARLTGTTLSGRGQGGAVWQVDLAQVSEAVYAEIRGWTGLRYALQLRGPDGWREVGVTVPRSRMVQSCDLAEHRALSAAVAERLAELRRAPARRVGSPTRRAPVAWLLLRRGQHRRWPAISAAALPGILTAAARRE